MSGGDEPLPLKRVYDAPEPSDRIRVLVERLWPRGLSKERAYVDTWLKDIAPSNELRKRYSHDPAKPAEFRTATRRSWHRSRPAARWSGCAIWRHTTS